MKTKIIILTISMLLVFSKFGFSIDEHNISEGSQLIKVGNKLCPVSGMKIGDMGPAVEFEYNGKIYNFCCAGCIDTFKSDPEKYENLVKERMQDKHSIESKGQSEGNTTLQENLQIREYEVFGMDCPGCHQGLEKLIKKIPAVEEAEANWKKKTLTVTIRQGEELNDEDIYDAVKRANFTVGKRIK
jgi:YHS domain-containing protein/copper chaperone CopZ